MAVAARPTPSLWRHPAFVPFWAAITVSAFGDHVSAVALPLVAVATLDATPAQMGLLGAAAGVPMLLLGLPAGAWVDRVHRRPVLIGADVGRALLLASIPAAAALGLLGMPYLYVVALLVSALTVFFNVAYMSFLPSLLPRSQLVDGNAKLSMSRSLASVAGPGLGGAAVQVLTAPVALLLDALSFALSGVCLAVIRRPESAPAPTTRRTWQDVAAGLRMVGGHPLLRASAGAAGTYNAFSALLGSVYVLYLTRELGVGPAVLGVLLALVGPGALLGATLVTRAGGRFGVGPRMIGGIALAGGANLLVPLVPLAGAGSAAALGILALAALANGFGQPFYNASQVSVRQAVTPDGFLGRVNATMQFLASATAPLGALAGGAIGQVVGLWPALVVGALGTSAAAAWLLLSPARTPNSVEELVPAAG